MLESCFVLSLSTNASTLYNSDTADNAEQPDKLAPNINTLVAVLLTIFDARLKASAYLTHL
jgi:hypothetical protein